MTFSRKQILLVLTSIVMLSAMGISACNCNSDTEGPPHSTTSLTSSTPTSITPSKPTTTLAPTTTPTSTLSPTLTTSTTAPITTLTTTSTTPTQTPTTTPAPTSTPTPTSTSAPTSTPTTTPTTTATPTTPTTTQDPNDKIDRSLILEGYPEHIWPIYGCIVIESCDFQILDPVFNNKGRYENSYSLIYVTNKTREEISTYYNSLLGEHGEPSEYSEAEGVIDGYDVYVWWYDYQVTLHVILPNSPPSTPDPFFKSWPVTSNHYLTNFPHDLLPMYELNQLWKEGYTVFRNPPPNGQTWATKLFTHSGTKAEALEFYRDKLGNAENYEEVVEEVYGLTSHTLKGTISGTRFKVIIGWLDRDEMIEITCYGVR